MEEKTEAGSAKTTTICYNCGETIEIKEKNGNESFLCKNESCQKDIEMCNGIPLMRFICLGVCRGTTIIAAPAPITKNCKKCGSNEIYEMNKLED